jgi:hypothetical protein
MSTHANAPLTPEGRRRLWGVGKKLSPAAIEPRSHEPRADCAANSPTVRQATDRTAAHAHHRRLLHRRPRRALQHRPSHRVPDTPAPSHQRKLSNPSSSFAAGDTILTGTPSLQTHRRWPPTRARRRRRRHQPRHADFDRPGGCEDRRQLLSGGNGRAAARTFELVIGVTSSNLVGACQYPAAPNKAANTRAMAAVGAKRT